MAYGRSRFTWTGYTRITGVPETTLNSHMAVMPRCSWHVWSSSWRCSGVPRCWASPSGFGSRGEIPEHPSCAGAGGAGVWIVGRLWAWRWAGSSHRPRCLQSWWKRAAQPEGNPALVSRILPPPARTHGSGLLRPGTTSSSQHLADSCSRHVRALRAGD